ncbi:MAG: hypothetical protein ACYTEL_20720 [Planctomycetota bacterium]
MARVGEWRIRKARTRFTYDADGIVLGDAYCVLRLWTSAERWWRLAVARGRRGRCCGRVRFGSASITQARRAGASKTARTDGSTSGGSGSVVRQEKTDIFV